MGVVVAVVVKILVVVESPVDGGQACGTCVKNPNWDPQYGVESQDREVDNELDYRESQF